MTANSSGIDLSIANTASPVSTPPRTTFLIASGFHSDFISNSIKSANVVTRSNSTLSNFTTSPKPIAENRGISSGDAAGIGIGTAFAGVFLALLGSWLFIKLKKRPGKWNHAAHRDTNTNGGGILAKDDIEKNNGISNSILAINYLPLERVDDSQIRKSIQDLNELILQHVENHYHKRPFQGRQEDLKGQLTGLSYTDLTEPSAHIIATLLADSRTRRTAIRQVICSTILRNTGLKSSIDTSLLPNYISAFGQEALKSVKTPGEDEAFTKNLTTWRQISSYLLDTILSNPENLESEIRPAIIRNVNMLNKAFSPFLEPGNNSQADNLASIILEGAIFGWTLFSQPGTWVFGWEDKDAKKGMGNVGDGRKFVVFPSIGEVIKVNGREELRILVDAAREDI